MKCRIATERLSKIYIARCGYTWLDESNWPQEWPPIPEDTFRELMLIATRGVEFSFNNQNLLHPVLTFTVEKEQNNSLNFLDVLVEKEATSTRSRVF